MDQRMSTHQIFINSLVLSTTPYPPKSESLNLSEYNLLPDDLSTVNELAKTLMGTHPSSVAEFGRHVAEHTAAYADTLLDQVRNKDVDIAGEKLSQIVTIAK